MKWIKVFGYWMIIWLGLLIFPTDVGATTYRIGDQIEFGQHDGNPVLWNVIDIDDDGNPLLFSRNILEWKAFDASSVEAGSVGSSRWSTSTLRQWLNSEEKQINWVPKKPDPTSVQPGHLGYTNEPGFLYQAFTPSEREALLEVTRHVPLSEADQAHRHSGSEQPSYIFVDPGFLILRNKDDVYRERVSDRVFVMNMDEMENVFFRTPHLVQATIGSALKKEPYRKTHDDPYWVVGPEWDQGRLMTIDAMEYMTDFDVNRGLGVRPALYLNKAKFAVRSGDGSQTNPYRATVPTIDLKTKRVTVRIGEGRTIDYAVIPAHLQPRLKWSSSAPTIASVSANGTVIGRRAGKTTISFKSASGQTGMIPVEVKAGRFTPTVKSISIDRTREVRENVDTYAHYLSAFNNISGGTAILTDAKKQLHVVYETSKDVRLLMYDHALKVKKRVTFKQEWPLFGDIALDPAGNYYVLWGRPLKETDHRSASIMITKYNAAGKRLGSAQWNGKSINTKIPFDAGNARIVYQDGVLFAHFARKMFVHTDGLNHQASQNVFLDATSMKPLKRPQPYVSHSFNQFLLKTKQGGVLFADQGDAYGRGFDIHYLEHETLINFIPFHFREGENWDYGYNKTFAQLGGLAEGSNGYALLGTSEKTLSAAPAKSYRNESRNLFMQFFRTDFEEYENSGKIEDVFLVKGSTRKLVGKRPNTGNARYFLDAGTKDVNVRWLTAYKGNMDAAHPKIVSTVDGRYVVMWEEFVNQEFKRVRMRIYSAYGEAMTPVIDVPKVRLPIDEDIVYQNGHVYWTTVTPTQDWTATHVQLHRVRVE